MQMCSWLSPPANYHVKDVISASSSLRYSQEAASRRAFQPPLGRLRLTLRGCAKCETRFFFFSALTAALRREAAPLELVRLTSTRSGCVRNHTE